MHTARLRSRMLQEHANLQMSPIMIFHAHKNEEKGDIIFLMNVRGNVIASTLHANIQFRRSAAVTVG